MYDALYRNSRPRSVTQTKVVLWNKIGHEEQGIKHKLDLIRFMATETYEPERRNACIP